MKPPTRLVLKLRARKSYRLAQIDINLTLSFLAAKARREMVSFIFSLGPLQLKISTLNLRLYSLSLKKKRHILALRQKVTPHILIKLCMVNNDPYRHPYFVTGYSSTIIRAAIMNNSII